MVDQVTFRSTDNARWGAGQGSDLSATQIDINFWVLLTAVQALQAESNENASIDFFVITGTSLFVHLTNHFVLGPYILPQANWNFTGEWIPHKAYNAFDVFTKDKAVYLVLVQHVSNTLFTPDDNDDGLPPLNYYGLLLAAPTPELPQTGVKGQLLQWQNSPADVRWFTTLRPIAFYAEGSLDPSETVMEYTFVEDVHFPIGLTGSQFDASERPTGDQEFEFLQDGGPCGHVIIHPSGAPTIVFNHAIDFVAGEVLSVVGPTSPDPHMRRVRFTFAGQLLETP